ncbi:SRPBCC family protein [Aliihoeflea sp. PC F10.4]
MTADDIALDISRFIDAPPAVVWSAWSNAEHFSKWWIPEPIECKVIKLDLRPGGGFETQMREGEGAFKPHVEGCFLDIAPEKRLAFTTVLAEGWQPIEPWLALTAIITFEAHGKGTQYRAHVMHKNSADTRKHAEMGFHDGWGTTIDQLAAYVEHLK